MWIPTGVPFPWLWLVCWLSHCSFLDAVAVDGTWSEWSDWGPCSASCEIGEKLRFRVCDPPPRNGGKWCAGKYRQKEECNFQSKCPVDGGWSGWSPWTECTVSCGEGSKQRFRSCSAPIPMNGGLPCQGMPQEKQNCLALRECPRDGKWSPWSRWSQCSVTCGHGGSVHRYRSCNNPPPAGDGRNCDGRNQQTKSCEAPSQCPINGQWSEWTEWTACSVTCGRGQRLRRRGCDNPPPFHGGKDCDRTEAAELQLQSCSGLVENCPVNGGWSEWSEWGSCNSPKCESSQVPSRSLRQRSCNSPLPENDGAMCQGTFLDAGLCGQPVNCKVDGKWGPWSDWDCTPFVVKRSRACDNPAPSNGGHKCTGENVEFYERGEKVYKEQCPQFPSNDEDMEESSGMKAVGSGGGMDDYDDRD